MSAWPDELGPVVGHYGHRTRFLPPNLSVSAPSNIPSPDRGNQVGEGEHRDLLPGTLYLLILRTLRNRPLHGYAITKRIREGSDGSLEIDDGSLYPALNRMLVKGWLTAEWGMSENHRRARFYRLTPEGRRRLNQESHAFSRMVRAIQLVMRTG